MIWFLLLSVLVVSGAYIRWQAVQNRRLVGELRAAVAARDIFLSVASHELRTPLTPLKLSIQRLKSGMPTEEAPAVIARMDKQVGRITALLNSILDVSQMSEGRAEFVFEEVDICGLIEDVIHRMRDDVFSSKCSVVFEAANARGTLVHADPSRLDQVVTNLLSNACKYGAGKPITIRAERVNGHVQVSVTDRGVGIPQEKIGLVFLRYERAVTSEQRHIGGLGLGLWISKQIVDTHRGSIHVVSRVGEGSTFTMVIPITVW